METALIAARSERQAMDWSLVLASQEVPTTIHFSNESGWHLEVEARDYARAMQAIRLFQSENRHWSWRHPLPHSDFHFHWGALFACTILALVHYANTQGSGDLRAAWIFNSAAASSGQWWRFFTAILLHADISHLLGNITTGLVLLGLAMGRFGGGPALLATLLAGALGNVAGLLLYAAPYFGLGASGMVMGALGLISAQTLAEWRSGRAPGLYWLRGVFAGLMLFVLLGVDPASDVVAHLGGFIGGGILGAGLVSLPQSVLESRKFVLGSGFVFLALLVFACWRGMASL
jgi:rhomboid protease GluP